MAIFEPVDQQATALDLLFREHRADLVALCRRRLGPGPDAEDAAHEAMLRAWRSRTSLDEGRDAWPWLATIAGNVCIDVHRRRATAGAYVAPRPDDPLGPEDLVVRGTHDGLLREALDQLTPAWREALLLREVEDWDYRQIAAHQRKSPGSVRTAVTRARQELRDHVEVLARARDQWPLAGVMGGLTARARSWQSAIARGVIRIDGVDGAMAAGSSAFAALAVTSMIVLSPSAASPSATMPSAPLAATVSSPAAAHSSVTSGRSATADASSTSTGPSAAPTGGAAPAPATEAVVTPEAPTIAPPALHELPSVAAPAASTGPVTDAFASPVPPVDPPESDVPATPPPSNPDLPLPG